MILVSGAASQLAQELKYLLSPEKTLFLDRFQLDISNADSVADVVRRYPVEGIINCAAYTNVDAAEHDEEMAYLVNVRGPANLARTGVPLIHISTDYVFDGQMTRPYTENDIHNPLSVYGCTKLQSEQVVLENSKHVLIIRTSGLYSRYGKNFVNTITRLAQSQSSIRVVSDQIMTPTWARDLARAIVEILPKFCSFSHCKELYHFSNASPCSWYEFANAIIKLQQFSCSLIPIRLEEYEAAAIRPLYSVLDTSKIERDFAVSIPAWYHSLAQFFASP